jgi:hypothetical protein
MFGQNDAAADFRVTWKFIWMLGAWLALYLGYTLGFGRAD